MKELDLSRAFQLIEPGPVVLVATEDQGKPNVMTVTWHMVMGFTPQIGCVIGPWDHSYAALRAKKECVLAIPTVDLAEQVIDIGNCSGRDVDKFEHFGLTALPGEIVGAPLVGECLANIECRVIDDRLVDDYNLFVLEGVKAWFDSARKERRTFHARGDGTFIVDGETLNLRSRMSKWQTII